MKIILSILISFCLLYSTKGEDHLQSHPGNNVFLQDTLKEDTINAASVIKEVVEARSIPQPDKVQYISQLTKYGFKNLFTQFKYNPSLSYSSQVNPHAELYMQDYLKLHSNYLLKMKSWGMPYFNLIDNIFGQYGLANELKYLAVIESNLNTKATSWVGAGGPWQFMPYTAKGLGLVVNKYSDERRDYFKSTHAAARYLLQLYRDLHDWLLVIAAYNGGPGRVYNAIKKSGSRDFWSLQYYLPLESRNHVKKFIATHYVMEAGNAAFLNESATENKPLLTAKEKENTSTQTITGKYNSKVIAKNLSFDIAEFNRYNPGFDKRIAKEGQIDLVLPTDKMQVFLANKYQILNECVQLLLDDNNTPDTKPALKQEKNRKKNR